MLQNALKMDVAETIPATTAVIRLVVRDEHSGRMGSMEIRLPLPDKEGAAEAIETSRDYRVLSEKQNKGLAGCFRSLLNRVRLRALGARLFHQILYDLLFPLTVLNTMKACIDHRELDMCLLEVRPLLDQLF